MLLGAASNYASYFEYLDALRQTGATNMFGARPYLEEEFDLSKAEASKVLSAWMQTFGKGDKTPEERAGEHGHVQEEVR